MGTENTENTESTGYLVLISKFDLDFNVLYPPVSCQISSNAEIILRKLFHCHPNRHKILPTRVAVSKIRFCHDETHKQTDPTTENHPNSSALVPIGIQTP